jgi:hypothetical protein
VKHMRIQPGLKKKVGLVLLLAVSLTIIPSILKPATAQATYVAGPYHGMTIEYSLSGVGLLTTINPCSEVVPLVSEYCYSQGTYLPDATDLTITGTIKVDPYTPVDPGATGDYSMDVTTDFGGNFIPIATSKFPVANGLSHPFTYTLPIGNQQEQGLAANGMHSGQIEIWVSEDSYGGRSNWTTDLRLKIGIDVYRGTVTTSTTEASSQESTTYGPQPQLEATFADGSRIGSPGDTLTVSGSGWMPGQTVTVDWGTIWPGSTTVTVRSDGSFAFKPTKIPSTTLAGEYEITATQGSVTVRTKITILGSLTTGITGTILEVGLVSITPTNNSFIKAIDEDTGAVYKSRGIANPQDSWDEETGAYVIFTPPGKYTVWAWAPCLIPEASYSVTVPPPSPEPTTTITMSSMTLVMAYMNIRLAPSAIQADFLVQDSTGTPIQGANIQLTSTVDQTWTKSTATNSTGQGSILLEGSLAPDIDVYTLTVNADGYATATGSISITIPYCSNSSSGPGPFISIIDVGTGLTISKGQIVIQLPSSSEANTETSATDSILFMVSTPTSQPVTYTSTDQNNPAGGYLGAIAIVIAVVAIALLLGRRYMTKKQLDSERS